MSATCIFHCFVVHKFQLHRRYETSRHLTGTAGESARREGARIRSQHSAFWIVVSRDERSHEF